jgi:glycosyltransferase involved in cell wall biosynthesis
MTVNEEPLVSVLTPVYNGEKYLSECIESVVAQTYQNWEYVIVNNCSTDRTQEIAQKYTQQDSRIRVHNNRQFVGMSENHNIALRQMSPESKYCKIVHADDWLFADCLRQMVELAESHPSVAIVGAYGLRGSEVVWTGLPYPSTVVSGRDVCRRTLMGGFYVFGTQTSQLIRADLIRNRSNLYNSAQLYVRFADQGACFQFLKDHDFGFVHQVLTYTREHEESATSSFDKTGLNSYLPSLLNILTKYGPLYLCGDEYDRRLKHVLSRYYRFLCRNLIHFRNKRFWEYHKDALNYVGQPFRPSALVKALLLEIWETVSNPRLLAAQTLGKAAKLVNR